ncbi:hypothetical protein [Sulfurimonas sp.]|uniref:hypothetical protein n=1 Tax=Sulfurimonas sp. TaxID=2022749 RepID=UPI003D09A22E
MSALKTMQDIKLLKKLKKNSEVKIEKEKQKIKEFESQIKAIQDNCKHDFEYKSVWYMEECTCKICGFWDMY